MNDRPAIPTDVPYSAAPELGLHGRWPLKVRLSGLQPVLDACAGRSVLDLGAAEGLVARRFLEHGAALVHGFEIRPERVAAARRICAGFAHADFRQGDLADWTAFQATHGAHLLGRYDIVLYLGLHHHLPPATRGATLGGAASLCGSVLAIRTPDACYAQDHIADRLPSAGLQLTGEHRDPVVDDLGPLRIFTRGLETG